MAIEVDQITGPAIFASALVNGDESGLESADIAALEAFIANLGDWQVVDVARGDDGEGLESRFTWSYRLHGGTAAGGDVIDYVVHRTTP